MFAAEIVIPNPNMEPDRILAAQIVRDECPSHLYSFIDMGEITPKGFDAAVTVHEVKWQD